MISFRARILFGVLKLIRFKHTIDFIHPKRSTDRLIPASIRKNHVVTSQYIEGRHVYNISPKGVDISLHVIYFHGGGYAFEPSTGHFHLVKKLIRLTKATITFVEYPLAPECDVHDTLRVSLAAYSQQIEAFPRHSFVLMGDSAGGGLALALAMLIRDQKMMLPEKIVLFSPWLDINLTNPKIEAYERLDLILKPESLRKIGEKYASDLSLKDFKVSPMFGNLDDLGKIAVFYGSNEILKPDCELLCNDKSAHNTKFYPFEFIGMQHDWVVLPIPEQASALMNVAEFLKSV